MMSSPRHLSSSWLRQLLPVLLKLCLAFAGPLRPLNGSECTAKGPASYIVVFTGHWSPQAFPKQYPLFRPPAQWSKLIAVSHNRHFRLWEEGSTASEGVQNFAELGVTVELMKAAKDARRRRSVGAMYRTAGIPNGIGHSSTELLVQPRSSLITSQMPNHPANSFYYPRLKELPPIASIMLTRQSRSLHRQVPMSNHILPNSFSPQRFSVTPLDCEVSLWSSWGLCLGPCSKGGVRHRTRYILLPPANTGVPCPEMEEQAECVPHSCMKRQ
ncbi:spondin-2a isoform X2 [Entelurus aequoreus]|uniref:spondin-2a isoform X2 n=1 Tax=Entelurus aequoreus TaxID=161455 RepID=UPI002B1DF0BD|nr:spondin-2a isoform X2 [Entelurus aequoreus]